MAGFWDNEHWADSYYSGAYWQNEERARPFLILPSSSGTYWSGTYWAATYFDPSYWRSHTDRIVRAEPGGGSGGYWDCYYFDQEYWEGGYWSQCQQQGGEEPPPPPEDERVHAGPIRLALNRAHQKRIVTSPLDYWQWFLRRREEPKKEEPVDDIEIVIEPDPEPVEALQPAVVEQPPKDQSAIDQKDLADLFALLGIVEEPKPDDDQDMHDILGVIGILETQ